MLPDGRLVRTASTAQDLALIVTLFRRKDGSFEKKEAAFTLVEEGRDGSVRTGEGESWGWGPPRLTRSLTVPLTAEEEEGNLHSAHTTRHAHARAHAHALTLTPILSLTLTRSASSARSASISPPSQARP